MPQNSYKTQVNIDKLIIGTKVKKTNIFLPKVYLGITKENINIITASVGRSFSITKKKELKFILRIKQTFLARIHRTIYLYMVAQSSSQHIKKCFKNNSADEMQY